MHISPENWLLNITDTPLTYHCQHLCIIRNINQRKRWNNSLATHPGGSPRFLPLLSILPAPFTLGQPFGPIQSFLTDCHLPQSGCLAMSNPMNWEGEWGEGVARRPRDHISCREMLDKASFNSLPGTAGISRDWTFNCLLFCSQAFGLDSFQRNPGLLGCGWSRPYLQQLSICLLFKIHF